MCEKCLNNIPVNQKFFFPQAGDFFNSFSNSKTSSCELDGILIASSYENILLNKSIKIFKYNFAFDLSRPLGKILINFLRQFDLSEKDDFLIVPIPLHKKRFSWRGFNQSELLAEEIGTFFKIKTAAGILKRIKNTKPQTKLKRKERQKNVKNIFSISFSLPQETLYKKIILIDDVTTTGSTLREAAKILKKAGFKNVWGLVLAKG
ncbi:MAG: phosphoribosyltransferase [Parcubacteria group bacterium Athens0714_12]|nr:MAG: phosphoribosyltransferase [Parcubacteria group bacterium Athens0714_12]